MTSEAYHEPFELLSGGAKDLHRALLSLQEELDAIDWYQQRVDVCDDEELRKVLAHNMREEIEHASMLLEWLQRNQADFSAQLREYLFSQGPVAHEEETGGAQQEAGHEEHGGHGRHDGQREEQIDEHEHHGGHHEQHAGGEEQAGRELRSGQIHDPGVEQHTSFAKNTRNEQPAAGAREANRPAASTSTAAAAVGTPRATIGSLKGTRR